MGCTSDLKLAADLGPVLALFHLIILILKRRRCLGGSNSDRWSRYLEGLLADH